MQYSSHKAGFRVEDTSIISGFLQIQEKPAWVDIRIFLYIILIIRYLNSKIKNKNF